MQLNFSKTGDSSAFDIDRIINVTREDSNSVYYEQTGRPYGYMNEFTFLKLSGSSLQLVLNESTFAEPW